MLFGLISILLEKVIRYCFQKDRTLCRYLIGKIRKEGKTKVPGKLRQDTGVLDMLLLVPLFMAWLLLLPISHDAEVFFESVLSFLQNSKWKYSCSPLSSRQGAIEARTWVDCPHWLASQFGRRTKDSDY